MVRKRRGLHEARSGGYMGYLLLGDGTSMVIVSGILLLALASTVILTVAKLSEYRDSRILY
jgi:hypothetical protein